MLFTNWATQSEKLGVHSFKLCALKCTHPFGWRREGRHGPPAVHLWVKEQLIGAYREGRMILSACHVFTGSNSYYEPGFYLMGTFPLDVIP